MTDPTIEPTPISKMATVTVPPSGTSLIPAIIYNPNKLGLGVGGWESKAVPVSLLSAALVNKVLSGHGPPTSLLGSDADFYIDIDVFWVYGPKAAGIWPAGVPMGTPADATLTVAAQATMLAGLAGRAAQAARQAQSVADQIITRIYGLAQVSQRSSIRARAAANQAQATVTAQAAFFAEAARARRKVATFTAGLGDDQIVLKAQFFS